MKKIVCLLMAVVRTMALAACGSTAAPSSSTPAPSGSEPSGSGLPAEIENIVKRGKLLVGVKTDVPNFGYDNPETGELEGMEIDLAKALAKKLLGDENKIEFQGVTAQTRGPLLDNGEVDVILATFTITEERKLSFNFTEPYYTDGIGFLVKKELGAKSITDLADKTIGVAQSATTKAALEEKAAELGISFKYSEFSGYPDLKTALTSGRIDAFCVDTSILRGYVDEQTEILAETFKPQEYGIVSKLSNKELAAYLDEFVAEMKSDGSLDALIAKWKL